MIILSARDLYIPLLKVIVEVNITDWWNRLTCSTGAHWHPLIWTFNWTKPLLLLGLGSHRSSSILPSFVMPAFIYCMERKFCFIGAWASILFPNAALPIKLQISRVTILFFLHLVGLFLLSYFSEVELRHLCLWGVMSTVICC